MKALVITTKDTAYVRDFAPPMSQTAEKVIGDWVERVRPTGLPGYLMLVDENPGYLPLPLAGWHGERSVACIAVLFRGHCPFSGKDERVLPRSHGTGDSPGTQCLSGRSVLGF